MQDYGCIALDIQAMCTLHHARFPVAIDLAVIKGNHGRNQSVAKFNKNNKANLRDLIAATGLVILLKLDSNRQFF